jgi:hypothetical protein
MSGYGQFSLPAGNQLLLTKRRPAASAFDHSDWLEHHFPRKD